MSNRVRGTVQSFSNEEGFGWIDGDDGVRYFVRFWDIQMDGYKTLSGSERVDFEVDPNAVGDDESRVAVDVRRLG
jgi:CspA family cold shock protein